MIQDVNILGMATKHQNSKHFSTANVKCYFTNIYVLIAVDYYRGLEVIFVQSKFKTTPSKTL